VHAVRVARLVGAVMALASSGAVVAAGCGSTTSGSVSFGSGAVRPMSIEPSCTGAADCLPGQICCFAFLSPVSGSNCRSGPCFAAMEGQEAFQLCASPAECLVDGDICGPPPVILPNLSQNVLACLPPEAGALPDAGPFGADGGLEAGTLDAGPADAEAGALDAGVVEAGDAVAHDG
jgi:hypothetical protein